MKKKILALAAAFLLLWAASAPVFADQITPHEDGEDFIYQEDWDTGSSDEWTDDSGTSYEETSSEESYEETSEESSQESFASAAGSPSPDASSQSSSSQASAAGGTVSSENSASSGSEDSNYVVFGKLRSKSNDIAGNMNLIAISCIALGVVGLICVIIWGAASRNIRRDPEEEVYQTVGQAQKNRQNSSSAQRRENPYLYHDSYNTNPKSAQPAPSARTRQSAPERRAPAANRSGATARQTTRQTNGRTQAAAPRPQTSSQRANPAPRPRPAATRKPDPHQFDTQELLNEILGDKHK